MSKWGYKPKTKTYNLTLAGFWGPPTVCSADFFNTPTPQSCPLKVRCVSAPVPWKTTVSKTHATFPEVSPGKNQQGLV